MEYPTNGPTSVYIYGFVPSHQTLIEGVNAFPVAPGTPLNVWVTVLDTPAEVEADEPVVVEGR